MAISELVTFDGGLSTKTSSHLIARNQGVICQNVNLESGVLKPYSSFSFVENVNGKHIISYGDTIISSQDETDDRFYETYGSRLYWTDKSYAGANGLRRYDGTNIGVDATAPDPYDQTNAPISAVATNDYGQLTSDAIYTYAITVVNEDIIESAPIFLAPVTLTSSQSQVKLSVDAALIATYLPVNSTVNIYRQGGDNPTFNLVVENMSPTHPDVVVDGSDLYWLDNVADINVSRIELTTFEHTSPPDGLDMLVENQGTMWGVVGRKVFFSMTGSPEYWGLLDYVQLDKEVTGLGKFGGDIVAFTRTSAYLITGYNRDNVVVTRLPFSQGCTNKHSVVNVDAYLLWTSLNGICIFNGSTIEVITKKTLSWDEFGRIGNTTYGDYDSTSLKWNSGLGFDIKYACGYQDKYYGVYNNGIMVIDLADGIKTSTIEAENISSLAINEDDNLLYAIVDAGDNTYDVYTILNSPNTMLATWKTGRLHDGSVNIRKHYRQVEIDGEPTSVSIFIDGQLKFTIENKSKFMLPSGLIGRDIQFEISTVNEIRSLKYQYSELKR